MKRLTALFLLAAIVSTPTWAARQTVTLAVPGMTCAACPITVKMALSKVEGVSETEVSYERREARVIFDDAETSVEALTQATANVGYPSTVKE